MHLGAAFLLGLVAGGVSCGIVQGSLLAGIVARSGGSTRGAVAEFLAGKLGSHVAAGAVLGAMGTMFGTHAWLQSGMLLIAGALIVLMGLTQLQVPGLQRLAVDPPAAWTRWVRARAHSASRFAPMALGFATILIPCAATVAAMALAATAGSVLAGAGTLGAFVLGTVPLFTVVGLAVGVARTQSRQWLSRAVGAVVLACGLWALNGGLVVAGSPLAIQRVAAAAGLVSTPGADASPVSNADGVQTGVVTVRSDGFTPANLAVRAGRPTRLVFRSDAATGCIRSLVIPGLGIRTVLPETGSRTVDLGTPRPGRIQYTCAMGMYSGTVTVR